MARGDFRELSVFKLTVRPTPRFEQPLRLEGGHCYGLMAIADLDGFTLGLEGKAGPLLSPVSASPLPPQIATPDMTAHGYALLGDACVQTAQAGKIVLSIPQPGQVVVRVFVRP